MSTVSTVLLHACITWACAKDFMASQTDSAQDSVGKLVDKFVDHSFNKVLTQPDMDRVTNGKSMGTGKTLTAARTATMNPPASLPTRTAFPLGPPGPLPTGTGFLPEETVKRAEGGSPVEKAKLAKDPSSAFNDVYEFSAAIRAGTLDWKDVEKADLETRLKWVGLLHRTKRTPGKFMMRLRVPNGVVYADTMRFFADSVEPYGPEQGVIDVTTRQNIQLRGVQLEDADKIIDGLHERGYTSLHSALDNVRNMVGSPLAGIDPLEMVDTRPYCDALNDLITINRETGKRGNPVYSNLPRKFNIAVSGSRDDFAHTHINDIGFQPCVHAVTGEMGFNIVLGGYMSTKRVAESIDMNLWMPARVDCAVELSEAILRLFRDMGDRKDRQKARLMWLVESYGKVEEVGGHLRAADGFREAIVKEMASYGKGLDKLVDVQQPRPTEPYERTGSPGSIMLGVHAQKQEGLSWVGIHVPVGRLSVSEAREIADLAEKYNPNGEIRLTVEQNALIPNVKNEDVEALLAEPALNGGRLSVHPGRIVGNIVSCTGSQFCGFAMVETKNNAEVIAKKVQERLDLDRDVRIHWTGCPNSCGQVQAADIGLMGGPAKKFDPVSGKMKAAPGVKVFLGGTIGEHGKLQLKAEPEAIVIEDLVPRLTDLVINKFGGKLKPEYEAEQAAFHAEQAKEKAAV